MRGSAQQVFPMGIVAYQDLIFDQLEEMAYASE